VSRLFYSPTAQLLIEAIPKCGLQTVISALLQIEGHDLYSLDSKFYTPESPYFGKFSNLCKKYEIYDRNKNDIPKITVVRNPYARGLSAFSDKFKRVIKDGEDRETYTYKQFNKFIKKLCKDAEKTIGQPGDRVEQWSVWDGQYKSNLSSLIKADHHFMPIVLQLKTIEEYDRVFCLEGIDLFYEYLNLRISEISPERGEVQFTRKPLNVSRSTKKYLSYLTEESKQFYINYYGDDFRILGYSTDIKDILKSAKISKEKP
tara:strand:+ start:1862 stop:2641 length:780 start_codon:yes stop_codon:yes gene_type:complete